MVALTAAVERRGDASLVEIVVANETPVPRRVRVANRLDGPVWPPRSEGVPADGWDDGGFEGILGPGERLGLGYASPAEPTDPPAEIAWSEQAAECEPERRSHSAAPDEHEMSKFTNRSEIEGNDPESIVRALGDPRPPRDVVAPRDDQPPDEYPDEENSDPDLRSGESDASRSCDAPPEVIETWFESVAERVERGDALAEPSSLLDAASAVEETGSLAAVERLVAQLDADAEALRRVERRAAALATRAEDAAEEVPVSSFRRLS